VTARRPDGSGGSLARDERIDDIQFYIDPAGELLIDDLILYEAAPGGEPRIMPSRPIFTGWLDTGKQGVEWPGEFQIVLHEKPWKWDAAKSVSLGKGGAQHLRVNMRGKRIMSPKTELSFRYKLTGRDGPLRNLREQGGRHPTPQQGAEGPTLWSVGRGQHPIRVRHANHRSEP
jgi:hypothetical protein